MKKAVIFILVKGEYILMEQRTFSEMYANVLVYPGGNVEAGETEEEAFIREAKEELGITPLDYQVLEEASYTSKNGVFVTPFLVKSWQGEIPDKILDQGNNLVWIELPKLKQSELELVRMVAGKLSLSDVAS